MAFLGRRIASLCVLIGLAWPCLAEEAFVTSNEKALKVAFLYNFALFTEWPPEIDSTLHLCILGHEPYGRELEELQGKPVSARTIVERSACNNAANSVEETGPRAAINGANNSRVICVGRGMRKLYNAT